MKSFTSASTRICAVPAIPTASVASNSTTTTTLTGFRLSTWPNQRITVVLGRCLGRGPHAPQNAPPFGSRLDLRQSAMSSRRAISRCLLRHMIAEKKVTCDAAAHLNCACSDCAWALQTSLGSILPDQAARS